MVNIRYMDEKMAEEDKGIPKESSIKIPWYEPVEAIRENQQSQEGVE